MCGSTCPGAVIISSSATTNALKRDITWPIFCAFGLVLVFSPASFTTKLWPKWRQCFAPIADGLTICNRPGIVPS